MSPTSQVFTPAIFVLLTIGNKRLQKLCVLIPLYSFIPTYGYIHTYTKQSLCIYIYAYINTHMYTDPYINLTFITGHYRKNFLKPNSIEMICNNSDYTDRKHTKTNQKSYSFWDIAPCSPLKVNRRLEGTYRLHLQGQRIFQARNQPV
jgi:hypothetical protein